MPDGQEGGLRQQYLNQLGLSTNAIDDDDTAPAVAREEIDEASVSSNAPEPPDTPRSELGIFTPGFDTRSEVSAASREPASPTSSRTDLASIDAETVEESDIPATIGSLALPVLVVDQDDRTPQLTPMATVMNVPDVAGEEATHQSTPEQKLKSVCQDGGHNVPEIFPGSSNILAGVPQTIHKKSVNLSPSLRMRVLIIIYTGPRSSI